MGAEASLPAGGAAPAVRNVTRRLATSRLSGVALALALCWAGFWALDPVFLSSQNLLNILLQSSNVAIVAAGLTVVMIAGEFDLSVGSMEGLAGAVVAVVSIKHGVPILIGVCAGLGAGVVVGLVNGLVSWRLGIPSFIGTLAMLGIVHGLALIVTDARGITGFPESFRVIGTGEVAGIPVPVLLAAGICIALYAVLGHTRFGLHVYAVGSNARAAHAAGLRPGRIKLFTFVLCGVTAAIGGLILSARLDAGNGTFGETDLLVAVAAVVIGGTSLSGGVGNVIGTALGVVLMASVQNGLVIMDVPAFWEEVAVGALILAAVLVDHVTRRQTRMREEMP